MKEFLIKIGIVIAAIFAPAKGMLLTSLLLIIIDLITGIMAARKSGEPITSSGIRRTVSKLLIYESAIVLAFLVQTYMTGDTVPVSNIVTGMIGLTELTSILENMNTIGGGAILKAIIDKIGSVNKQ